MLVMIQERVGTNAGFGSFQRRIISLVCVHARVCLNPLPTSNRLNWRSVRPKSQLSRCVLCFVNQLSIVTAHKGEISLQGDFRSFPPHVLSIFCLFLLRNLRLDFLPLWTNCFHFGQFSAFLVILAIVRHFGSFYPNQPFLGHLCISVTKWPFMLTTADKWSKMLLKWLRCCMNCSDLDENGWTWLKVADNRPMARNGPKWLWLLGKWPKLARCQKIAHFPHILACIPHMLLYVSTPCSLNDRLAACLWGPGVGIQSPIRNLLGPKFYSPRIFCATHQRILRPKITGSPNRHKDRCYPIDVLFFFPSRKTIHLEAEPRFERGVTLGCEFKTIKKAG